MEEWEIRVGICDDCIDDIARMEDALRKGVQSTGQPIQLKCQRFTDGEKLYEATRTEKFDLLFLDIEMPKLSGFELAERLCMDRPSTHLIFVSSHESFVFDAPEYMPLWFVRKSNLEKDMFRALRKYLQITASTRVNYRLKEGFAFRELPLRDILYVEGTGHSLFIRKTDGTCLKKYGTLKAMEEELEGHHFLRIHKNYLVNQKYIKEVGKREVYLMDDSVLEMGRDRRVKIREAVLQYEKECYGDQ